MWLKRLLVVKFDIASPPTSFHRPRLVFPPARIRNHLATRFLNFPSSSIVPEMDLSTIIHFLLLCMKIEEGRGITRVALALSFAE